MGRSWMGIVVLHCFSLWGWLRARLVLFALAAEAVVEEPPSPSELDESMSGQDPVARLNPINPYHYHAPEYLSGMGFGQDEMRGHERDFR